MSSPTWHDSEILRDAPLKRLHSLCDTSDVVLPDVLFDYVLRRGAPLCMKVTLWLPFCGTSTLSLGFVFHLQKRVNKAKLDHFLCRLIATARTSKPVIAYIIYFSDIFLLSCLHLLVLTCRQGHKNKNVGMGSIETSRWRFQSAGKLTKCLGLWRDLLDRSSN